MFDLTPIAFYTSGGLEIIVPKLDIQKQVVGGEAYKQGIGFSKASID